MVMSDVFCLSASTFFEVPCVFCDYQRLQQWKRSKFMEEQDWRWGHSCHVKLLNPSRVGNKKQELTPHFPWNLFFPDVNSRGAVESAKPLGLGVYFYFPPFQDVKPRPARATCQCLRVCCTFRWPMSACGVPKGLSSQTSPNHQPTIQAAKWDTPTSKNHP